MLSFTSSSDTRMPSSPGGKCLVLLAVALILCAVGTEVTGRLAGFHLEGCRDEFRAAWRSGLAGCGGAMTMGVLVAL